MFETLIRAIVSLLYSVNWGSVCYFISAIFGLFAVSSFDTTSDMWWAYFLGFAAASIIFVAIGARESARYFRRVQKQQERAFERIQRRAKLHNDAKKALREHEEIMAKRAKTSQM